jgi:hypothetical protein
MAGRPHGVITLYRSSINCILIFKVSSMIRGTLNGYYLGDSYGAITISPSGGQPLAGLLAAQGLTAIRTYLVVLVTY